MSFILGIVGVFVLCMSAEAGDGSYTMEFDGFVVEQDFTIRWRFLMFGDFNLV